jgi:hypothetical protein
MLHTLTESGHMMWTCPCGADLMAHISNPDVQHPTSDEMETVVEGTHVDDQGRTWTRHLTRPTGKKIIHSSHIALPKCDCGKQTFLAVPTDEHYANVAKVNEDGILTNASIEALNRTKELARQMINAGKGPTN